MFEKLLMIIAAIGSDGLSSFLTKASKMLLNMKKGAKAHVVAM